MIDSQLINAIESYLEEKFKNDPFRLAHIYSVKKVAIHLGSIHHEQIPRVVVASYLHDAAKNTKIDNRDYQKDDLTPLPCLHAYQAAILAEDMFKIHDEDILNAIRYHCTGRKEMSTLEKIIFVSDFIEPGRQFVSEKLRKLAEINLDKAVLEVMLEKKKYIHLIGETYSSISEEALQYYLTEREEFND